jgi:hypothetical protein
VIDARSINESGYGTLGNFVYLKSKKIMEKISVYKVKEENS